MTHEEALNKILAEACPSYCEEEKNVKHFTIELHCATMRVVAKSLGNLKFEIISVEKEKCESEAATESKSDKPLDPPLGYSDGGWRG
jgi:hypothetical protein